MLMHAAELPLKRLLSRREVVADGTADSRALIMLDEAACH